MIFKKSKKLEKSNQIPSPASSTTQSHSLCAHRSSPAAIHEPSRTMMLCFWLFVFSVHFVLASSRSTGSYQNGFQNSMVQNAYQNSYRSNRNALGSDGPNGSDDEDPSRASSRSRRARPKVSGSRSDSRSDSKNDSKSGNNKNNDQLLAESSNDDQYVEPSMLSDSMADHAFSSLSSSFHKKVG